MEGDVKKKLVEYFMSRDILVSPEILEAIDEGNQEEITKKLQEQASSDELCVLTNEVARLLGSRDVGEVQWSEVERSKYFYDRGVNTQGYEQVVSAISQTSPSQEQKGTGDDRKVEVVFSYDATQKKKEVQEFVKYFKMRYKEMEKILSQRQELSNLLPITRILQKKERETVSLIGLISDIQHTKNGNIMLTLEDPTGRVKVLVNQNKPEVFEASQQLVLDETIGVNGVSDGNIVFLNTFVWPEIPNTKELKKSPDEAYAIFISDLHVGSNEFLEKDLNRFLSWLRGEMGNEEQRRIASKVKYVFIAGDLIDGVGIYPGQEDDLAIPDMYKQYEKCAEVLSKVPDHITIILSPGNHDAMRLSEPQPPLYTDYAKALWDLPNVVMVSNPAVVNIHKDEEFSGFDVLLYHGYSFDHFANEVEYLRVNKAYDNAEIMMRFLLQRRHLAPTHTSTLYIPHTEYDPLVIGNIPDFFVTGHIHKCSVGIYRNVTLICGSCWQSQTDFQEKVGLEPEPSKVALVNLQTRNVKIMKFGDSDG